MKSRLLGAVCACLMTQAIIVSQAFGGLIVVSADLNIVFPIDGSHGQAVNPGNSTLFSNILSGGSTVGVYGNGFLGSDYTDAASTIDSFYDSQSGTTSYNLSGSQLGNTAITDSLDLLVLVGDSGLDSTYYLNMMSAILDRDGAIFLISDHEGISNNSILSSLGSTMATYDAFSQPSSYNPTQNIAADSLTTGVSSVSYAFTGGVSGGTSLVSTQPAFGGDGITFIAYENISTVPVPAAAWLFGSGLLGLVGMARRKKLA